MNILVTGANGQLGNCMRNAASGSADNYIFTDVSELDITDSGAVARMVKDNGIDVIVNCAAYTNVDKAEDDFDFAEKLNAEAVRNLAEAVKQNDGWLIQVSTDYVFGKEPYNVPCREDQKGTPTGVYGLTKLHGEQAIAESGAKSLIFRTAWLYSEYGNNFVKTMLRLAKDHDEIRVVCDQIGTPTYAGDLARAIHHILRHDRWVPGIYHYTDEGVASWYDFAKSIFDIAGIDMKVTPIPTRDYPTPAKRPLYSVLSKGKIKNVFGMDIPYWRNSLKECIGKLQKESN